MKTVWSSPAVCLFLASMVKADLMPARFDGYVLSPRANCDIRMASEEVNLYLVTTEKANLYGNELCRVTARFDMVNDTNEPIDLFVGFPVAGGMSRTELPDFKALINGVVPVENLQNIPEYSEDRKSWESPRYTWFGWDQSFPPGPTVVEVEYSIIPSPSKPFPSWRNVYYVLHTGDYWKGSIGQADVVVHFDEPITRQHIRGETKPRGFTVDDNRVRWHFTNFDPTLLDNIQLEYIPLSLYRELQDLKQRVEENPEDESCSLELARRYLALGFARGYYGPPPGLEEEDYVAVLAEITDPNDKAIFTDYYSVSTEWPDPNRFLREGDSRWEAVVSRLRERMIRQQPEGAKGLPDNRIERIMCAAGYVPSEPWEYSLEAKDVLERLLAKNPKNADAWMLYVDNCHKFVVDAYTPRWRWEGPIPAAQRELVERAYANCPSHKGIKAWYALVTSDAANSRTEPTELTAALGVGR